MRSNEITKEYPPKNLRLGNEAQKLNGEDAKGMVWQGKRAALRVQESTFQEPKEALTLRKNGSKIIPIRIVDNRKGLRRVPLPSNHDSARPRIPVAAGACRAALPSKHDSTSAIPTSLKEFFLCEFTHTAPVEKHAKQAQNKRFNYGTDK